MAVEVRPERRRRVVDVQAAQPVEPDAAVELGNRRVERRGVGDIDARGPPVAGVEADTESRVTVDGVDERGELVERAADRATGARAVLQQ